MGYLRARRGVGQWQPGIVGGSSPDLPVGLPGPGSPMMGPVIPPDVPQPTMPASLFPTHVKEGDVIQVGGPFAGKFQGQVIVRFTNAPGQAIYLTSAHGGTVVVPDGAQTGACSIELDGRTIYTAHCVIGKSDAAKAPQHRGAEAYREFSTFGPLSGIREHRPGRPGYNPFLQRLLEARRKEHAAPTDAAMPLVAGAPAAAGPWRLLLVLGAAGVGLWLVARWRRRRRKVG